MMENNNENNNAFAGAVDVRPMTVLLLDHRNPPDLRSVPDDDDDGDNVEGFVLRRSHPPLDCDDQPKNS